MRANYEDIMAGSQRELILGSQDACVGFDFRLIYTELDGYDYLCQT